MQQNPTTLALMTRPEFGSHAENTAAMDWFVLANLGFLFFLMGCFAIGGWLIWRRTTRPEPHIRLLMEMEEESTQTESAKPTASSDAAAPWERQADWWKQ